MANRCHKSHKPNLETLAAMAEFDGKSHESKKLQTFLDGAVRLAVPDGRDKAGRFMEALRHDARIAHEQREVMLQQDNAIRRLREAVQRLRERAPQAACIADRTAQLNADAALAAAAPFLED